MASTALISSRRIEGRRISNLKEVDQILDRQRRLAVMASNGNRMYSIIDLGLLVEQCREDAKSKILACYSETLVVSPASEELVLHAAAELRVSPLNTIQLVQDYPECIYHMNNGMLPLHLVVAATGIDHAGRVKAFLSVFPESAKVLDARELLPVQIALLHGAEWDVVKLLIEAFPLALQYPFLPCAHPIQDHFSEFIGMKPFLLACSLNYSLNSLFQLLAGSPDSITDSWRIHDG